MNEQVASAEAATRVEPHDADLVKQAKARSPEAWTEIYNTHHAAIFRYAKARVFDETTAEDLASAVFVGALALGPGSENLKEGLGLPRRVIWHLFRRPRRDDVATGQDLVETVSGAGDPAMMIDRFNLRDALAKLPTNQREVVILRFLVGLSAQEVAAVTGKRTTAIYSLQARAILALRERLK